jgi:maltooligosyltrehalose trehalohydrolase
VRRGTPAGDHPAWQFLYVIQNHDQVGNRAFGERLNHQIDLPRYRAASTLLLFLPFTPMVFMGQEFAASTPFQYFTDHNPELGRLVTEGRRREFQAFAAFADPATRDRIPDPQAESTFLDSKLRLIELESSPGKDVAALYRDLLGLRCSDPVLRDQSRERTAAHALTDDVLVVRRWLDNGEHRLLVVNFADTPFTLPESGEVWHVIFASRPGEAADAAAGVRVGPRTAVILATRRP